MNGSDRFAVCSGKVQVLSLCIGGMVLLLAAILVVPMLSSGRDLSMPATRLVGHWESDTDRMMTHALYGPVDASGAGTCFNPDGTVHFTYKVVSEDRSGTRLVTQECENGRVVVEVEFQVAKDGRSMTKEYMMGDGNRWIFNYHYVDRDWQGSPSSDDAQGF